MLITKKKLDEINNLVETLEIARGDLEKLPRISYHHVYIGTGDDAKRIHLLIHNDIIRGLLEEEVVKMETRLKSLGFVED